MNFNEFFSLPVRIGVELFVQFGRPGLCALPHITHEKQRLSSISFKEKRRFCFRENDFFRCALNCHPLQQIRMRLNPYFDDFQRLRFDVLIDFDVKKYVLKG